jgi:hypothetical protein
VLILLLSFAQACALSLKRPNRRFLLSGGAIAWTSTFVSTPPVCFATSAPPTGSLVSRLEQELLQKPSVSDVSNGIDDIFYPELLLGTWQVTQTLVNVTAPLGLVYLGGPNAIESIAKTTLSDSQSRLNQPVQFTLRYVPTKWGVVEDRIYNAASRLNAYAGKRVVASASYADVRASNRASVMAHGGDESDPLQTVFVRFQGPAAQKTFVTSHSAERLSEASWVGSEGQRSIFALTNQNTAPPIFTDSELIWKFDRVNSEHVLGRLRIAGYLNAQSDALYFEVRNRAVSIQDYSLDMKRID